MTGTFGLERFVAAQSNSYESALAEIRRGKKRGHWMWFIFPQLIGLGTSAMAQRYAIRSLEEARAYLDHPLLGARYRECVSALQAATDGNPAEVLGPIDAMKLRSSLTLFAEASGSAVLRAALSRWFGSRDAITMRLLSA